MEPLSSLPSFVNTQGRLARPGVLESGRALGKAIRGERYQLNDVLWRLVRRPDSKIGLRIDHEEVFYPFDSAAFEGLAQRFPMADLRTWAQVERTLVLDGPAIVEPTFGWTIVRPATLVGHGVINIHSARSPSMSDYVSSRFRRKPHYASVVNLRDGAEMNYGHFLTDLVGGRLRLADKIDGVGDLPVLVGKRLAESQFFQQIRAHSRLADRDVIVQDGPIESDQVYLFDTSHYSLLTPRFLQDFCLVPPSNASAERRVFIARPPKRNGRAFTNMDDVERICRRFGFEIVLTEDMSFTRKLELFSEARYVAGVGGAGLTNIVFRRQAPLSLLEIFAPGAGPRPRPWWFAMCAALGFNYRLMCCDPLTPILGKSAHRHDFAIDAGSLEKALEDFLIED